MPWTAGFQTTVPGMDEARLDAFQTLLQGKIAHLDAALSRDSLLPVGTAGSDLVILGDPDLFAPVEVTPFLLCITGGGKSNAVDAETIYRYVGAVSVSSLRNTVHSQIRGYLHPDLFPVGDSAWATVRSQTEARERLLSRLADWIRADCFQQNAGFDLTLASQETDPAGDQLTMGVIREIRKGRFDKSFAGQWGVYGLEFHIEHTLN